MLKLRPLPEFENKTTLDCTKCIYLLNCRQKIENNAEVIYDDHAFHIRTKLLGWIPLFKCEFYEDVFPDDLEIGEQCPFAKNNNECPIECTGKWCSSVDENCVRIQTFCQVCGDETGIDLWGPEFCSKKCYLLNVKENE